MADTKITALTALTAPTTDDLVAVVDAPSGSAITQKLTLANLLTLFVSNVVVQVKTSGTGTYTPTALMKKVLVICVGGGGGVPSENANDAAISGGGGGGTAIKLFTAAEIGGSKSYTVGAASTGAGNNSFLGAGGSEILLATGGGIGVSTGNSAGAAVRGGQGGIGSLGDLNFRGDSGDAGVTVSTTFGWGGQGGDSFVGAGGRPGLNTQIGEAGFDYGGGAGGSHVSDGTDEAAVSSAAGIMYFIEFLN
jgi:hypothetical protein